MAVATINAAFLTGQHSVRVSPSVTSHSSNILRGPGNVAQVATYSKTVETGPYSSQTKSDLRVSSPGVYSPDGSVVYHSRNQGVSPTGYGRDSGPSINHVTYNTGPVAYATAPTLGHDVGSYGPSSYADQAVGSSREHTVQSLDGNHAVTHYTKAVDTAFSSVRKTNDGKIVSAEPASLAYASATAYASPIVAKGTPGVTYTSDPVVAHATFAGMGTQYNW